MIRVVLPAHLRTLARVSGEVKLDVQGSVTQNSVLDALEALHPELAALVAPGRWRDWLDAEGNVHEKIHDVAWGGDREPGADGKLPPVGNTVDVPNATWSNTIGAPELITVWVDPEFDAKQRAFYYARVIEIPTPRWTAYDANRFGLTMPPEVPMTTTERAYTSPIWYTP